MKFRIRKSTDILYIHLIDTQGKTTMELQREVRRKGQLALGYHYVVQREGLVEQGREPYAVAGYDLANQESLENPETSIHILVDAKKGTRKPLTDVQKVALGDLKESILGEFPHIQIINL
jgi:hypothetical protein